MGTTRLHRRALQTRALWMQALRLRGAKLIVVTAGTWVAVALVAMGVGAVHLPPGQIARMLLHAVGWLGLEADWPRSHEVILYQLRLPRVILGGLVGAALGLSGATLQGLFRNPMASPFVLGVSSGASVGAVLAMVLGTRVHIFGLRAVPLMAFGMALLTVILVYNLARIKGRVPTGNLLLSGIALSSFLSAMVSLLLVFNQEKVGMILFWLMGGLGGAEWGSIRAVLPYMVLGVIVTLVHARDLNIMLLGEAPAQHLGLQVERVKRRLLLAVSLMTAAAVSVSGVIGFVGLIIPHVVRMLMGPDHRLLMPLSALVGGMFLMVADTLARTLLAPSEIPVGVITALCGAPFFLWLLRKRRVPTI